MRAKRIATLYRRDLFLVRKTALLYFIGIVCLVIFLGMTLLSSYYGNIERAMKGENEEMLKGLRSAVLYSLELLLPMILASSLFQTVTTSDIRTGWRNYVFATPASPAERALARWLADGTQIVAGLAVVLLSCRGLSAIGGIPFTVRTVELILLVFAVMWLTTALSGPACLLASTVNGTQYILAAVTCGVFLILFGAVFFTGFGQMLRGAETVEEIQRILRILTENYQPLLDPFLKSSWLILPGVWTLELVLMLAAMKRRPLK